MLISMSMKRSIINPYPFVCIFPGSSSVKNLLSRKKRAVSNTTTEEPFGNATSLEFMPVEANFSLIFTTTGCRTWTDDNNSWTMEGCTVNFVFRLHLSTYSSSTNVKVRKKEKTINARVKVRYMYVSHQNIDFWSKVNTKSIKIQDIKYPEHGCIISLSLYLLWL